MADVLDEDVQVGVLRHGNRESPVVVRDGLQIVVQHVHNSVLNGLAFRIIEHTLDGGPLGMGDAEGQNQKT